MNQEEFTNDINNLVRNPVFRFADAEQLAGDLTDLGYAKTAKTTELATISDAANRLRSAANAIQSVVDAVQVSVGVKILGSTTSINIGWKGDDNA